MSEKCPNCQFDILAYAKNCHHCGEPLGFPNVRAAMRELGNLQNRYNAARQNAASRAFEHVFDDFEKEVTANSKAVIARNELEITRLLTSDKEGYSTFYKLADAEVRFPDEGGVNIIRKLANAALFTGYEEEIRFAALSLDGVGVNSYGNCILELKNEMIEKRATAFEENSVTFMKNHNIQVSEAHNIPKGYRAAWDQRGKLAAAKHVKDLSSHAQKNDYPGIVLKQGATQMDDIFIEVHIYGIITCRAFAGIVIKTQAKSSKAMQKKIMDEAKSLGVRVVVK